MRSRNIKPSFFKNELLGEMPEEARLLFIGLWCLADRDGRLEDRPKRIEAELFPYQKMNVAKHLQAFASAIPPFILRYEANSNRYIQIINFARHQSPNPHERKSDIPPCICIADAKYSNAPLNPSLLNPSLLNPSLLNPSLLQTAMPEPTAPVFDFVSLWNQYPKRLGRKAAERHFRSSVKADVDFQNIRKALANYLRSVSGKEAQYVQNGSTWFNNWQDWIEYREVKDNASNGGAGRVNDSDFFQRIREAKGLRKTEFQGPTGKILAGIRDMQNDEEQAGESIGSGD